MTDDKTIAAYHEATKHHFHRYARSAGYMDWANQPDAFRIYEQSTQTKLPLGQPASEMTFAELFSAPPAPGGSIRMQAIASFFEHSLALSAWKQSGQSRWPLRVNPSSGNLHPTESYLMVWDVPELADGIYHYNPLHHALERRAGVEHDFGNRLSAHFGGPGFLVALSSIAWRESWKYGERAFRYCLLDAGHALAALAFAARLHGWHLICLSAAADSSIGQLLGFHQTAWHPNEDEVTEMILWVSRQPFPGSAAFDLPEDLAQRVSSGDVFGTPNRLSPKAVAWPIIGQAAAAVEKGTTREVYPSVVQEPPESDAGTSPRAADVIRRRRSAVQFNPQRSIDARTLFDILGRTIAGRDTPPFNAAPPPGPVELVVFVHQVDALEQGIYLLKRSAQALENLRSAWTEQFLWEPVPCPLPLWRLKAGDVTDLAATLSCQQDIAGQSAFAVAMIAPFEHVVRPAPYRYRHLHWECGMIGQVLYLAAEAHGLRGTGIGCFFDDEVHRLLGIRDTSYQTLYHFTVGHPIEDDRLSTLPAYHHLESSDR